MLTIDRWRNWRPSDGKFDEPLKYQPPKPTEHYFEGFEGSTPGRMQNFSDVPPDHDPEAWSEDFARWMAENCICRMGREDAGAIGTLLSDFAQWCVEHDAVPCQRRVFEKLLTQAGFRCVEGMATGLLLRVDLEAILHFQDAPESSKTPARPRRESGQQTGTA